MRKKMKLTYGVIAALLLVLGAGTAWPQATLAKVQGKITDNDKPLAEVQVVFTSVANGRTNKVKTDKVGFYFLVGLPFDDYEIEIVNASGEGIYKGKYHVVPNTGGQAGTPVVINIDVTKDTKGSGGKDSGQPKISKEELERIKAENSRATNINALINQYNAAKDAQNWPEAEAALKQMIAADPNRWEYFQALGIAQMNQQEYQESIDSNEKGIQAAQGYASGTTPKDPKNANSEPAKAKAGMGQMLASEGNAYLKLKKNSEAIAVFNKAAEMDPNPAVAYFNICATQYNTGNMEGAAAACDKAIQADPNKADAYFIKGSALFGQGKMDAQNKYVPPPGTAEAFKKYLELAPDGSHAADVKAMLEAVGAKIETSYKDRPVKKK